MTETAAEGRKARCLYCQKTYLTAEAPGVVVDRKPGSCNERCDCGIERRLHAGNQDGQEYPRVSPFACSSFTGSGGDDDVYDGCRGWE